LQAYKEVFQDPKKVQPNMEVDHKIKLLLDYALQNIVSYILSILEEDEVSKKLRQLLDY
jgi:hypothetical protein